VRKFVLGSGNADSYMGLRINFIPHHSPMMYLFDENGAERQEIDLSPMSFNELNELMEREGFKKKELL